jgi:hypothetical protein
VCPVTLVSDGKRPETRHLCFAACWSSVRQRPFPRPKSLDAPEPGALKVNNFHGKPIAYNGLAFSGSPVLVFWNGYIEPFLEDIAFRAIDLTMSAAKDRGIGLRQPLLEVQGQLYSLCRRTFDRMASIDQRLRKAGVLDEVPLRSTVNELARMHQFIDRRIEAELSAIALPATPGVWKRVNQWHKDNQLLFWAIPTSVAIIGLAAKIFGLF